MNCTRGHLKQGVRPQAKCRTMIQKPTMEGGVSNPEFASEVLAFEVELTARRGDTDLTTHRSELSRIERVATSSGLSMNRDEVAVNGGQRRRVLAKSLELGVVPIAERAAAEDFAGK